VMIVVGDDCYLMNKVYIGYDNGIGDGVTMVFSVILGGHIQVGLGVNFGMVVVVHQRRFIGFGAMVGMGLVVMRDVLLYVLVYGNLCWVCGVNWVGMQCVGVDDVTIQRIDGDYCVGCWDVDLCDGGQ